MEFRSPILFFVATLCAAPLLFAATPAPTPVPVASPAAPAPAMTATDPRVAIAAKMQGVKPEDLHATPDSGHL